MGTNYYAIHDCEYCGLDPERGIHIGQDATGWRFLVDAPAVGTTRWPDLVRFMRAHRLVDEYARPISLETLVGTIEASANERLRAGATSHGPADFDPQGGFC